jgi:hypothetical protein
LIRCQTNAESLQEKWVYNRKKIAPIFYTNANPKVLREILENKYDVIEKDFLKNLPSLNQLEYIT